MVSKAVSIHQPCPSCGSSDALSINEDGSTKCYSCGEFKPGSSDNVLVDSGSGDDKAPREERQSYVDTLTWQYAGNRGVSRKTFEFFGCKTGVDTHSNPVVLQFPYPNGRTLNKRLDEKKFFWTGSKTREGFPLFGMDKFPRGGKAITITEGALDACSVVEAMGEWPTVSVSSASAARSECTEARDYLNSFDKIVLCFDMDEPGQKAAKEVARLFDFNKVYMVQMDRKDANEYIQEKDGHIFSRLWWAASRFVPEGILTSYAQFDKIIDDDVEKEAIPYPWADVQAKTYGIRTGELVLLTAQEGMGKTEFFRALEYHILKTTDDNIGIIHLEENKARTLKGLVGYEVKAPIHLPDRAIPKEEIKTKLREVIKRDDRVHVYSHFGSDDPDTILDTVRFMAGPCGCKRIFLDHITMVVSGLAGDDERRALDYISTRLAMMVEELDFTLFLISHVNDEGQTRGSRNIGKVADLRVDLHRDLMAENEIARNTTKLVVTKNRYAGRTGPTSSLYFDPDTYVLAEAEEEGLPF